MNYKNSIKRSITRSNIKFLILYTLLALIAGSGALSFFTTGNSLNLLDLIPVPSTIAGGIFLVLFLLLLYLDIQTLLSTVRSSAYADWLDNLNRLGDPDSILDYVEHMPKSSLCTQGDFRCDENYVAYSLGDLAVLQPSRNIVWGYLQAPASKTSYKKDATHKTNEPPNVVLRLTNRQNIIVRTKNQENAKKLLDYIQTCSPDMTTEYSAKLENLYAKNPEKLRKPAAKSGR